MSADTWQRLDQAFEEALRLEPEARAAWLETLFPDEPYLLDELRRLLAAHARADGFLSEVPARAVLAALEDDPQATMTGQQLGAYRILREVGRGGMGTVYLGERADGAFQKSVAIKITKRGLDTDAILRRFREERRILASLEHPNIARLLDAGTSDDGRPYIVMEYIEGQHIDSFAAAMKLTIPERLTLFLEVCEAVSYAHRQRVVHRDIKPSNILISASGAPRLLDFGIAKLLESDESDAVTTVTDWRMLTPEYASPEQIEGRHASPMSDVYSLGVVLYELLTGRSPYHFLSRAPHEIAKSVCTTDPVKPSAAVTRPVGQAGDEARPRATRVDIWSATCDGSARALQRRLRGELDNIVMKALRKEPERRYQSVRELSADLRRHLDGFPVDAGADGLLYRGSRLASRNRGVLALGSVALLAVAALVWEKTGRNRTAASPASKSRFESFVVECSSTGLTCDEGFSEQVTTAGPLSVDYRVTSAFCGNILLDVLVDGVVVRSGIGPLGPVALGGARGTGELDLGPVAAGTHAVELRAAGVRNSGCIKDELDVWAGQVKVQGG
jgi:serine/threonine protein kinase